jgi:signal transduction histidine kinase
MTSGTLPALAPRVEWPPMTATHRYTIAALAACLIFGLLELNAPWVAGPARAELHHPAGVLARWLASQFTPPPSALRAGSDRQALAHALFIGAQALLVVTFTGLLWWRIRPGLVRSHRLDTVLACGLLVTAVAIDSLAFHVVLATTLAALLPLRRAWRWLAAMLVLGVGVDIWMLATVRAGMNDSYLLAVLGTLTFERIILLLGAAIAWLARQEQAGRVRLAASHAQLRATQSLLADTVRTSERMRIARDLHDAVGHHLTALNLHLDLAMRQSEGRQPGALVTARELGQSLLAEVRSVVSAKREEQGVNLRQALELLCAGIPSPAIDLAVDRRIDACPPAAAHTLLYCVQEAITNTVRHAGASRLAIDIRTSGHGVAAHISDDGRGGGAAPEGNGLSGMRERLAAQGGTLRVGNGGDEPGGAAGGQPARLRGYWLAVSLPLTGAPS